VVVPLELLQQLKALVFMLSWCDDKCLSFVTLLGTGEAFKLLRDLN
jgi:hypothetical protein